MKNGISPAFARYAFAEKINKETIAKGDVDRMVKQMKELEGEPDLMALTVQNGELCVGGKYHKDFWKELCEYEKGTHTEVLFIKLIEERLAGE